MVSQESVQATSSSPRISFSTDDDTNFISISLNSAAPKGYDIERERIRNVDFEFLSSDSATNTMITADELFFDGKLLPFWQIEHSEKLNKITLKPKEEDKEENKNENKEDGRVNLFMDEDPSPRPPTCTVLWKELLKLRKQRSSSLSPSSSSSSSVLVDMGSIDDGKEGKEGKWNREKHVKRIKKGLERTRSANFSIRPVVNVPICTQGKNNNGFPYLFSLKRGNV